MGVPEGAIRSGSPVVVVDGTSRVIAVGVDGDGADELLNDRVLFGCTRTVDPTGQTVEQLFEAATLSCLVVESLRPVVEARDVLLDLR